MAVYPGDSYFVLERRLKPGVQRWLGRLLGPLVNLLCRLRISPDVVSSLQLPLAVGFFCTLPRWPRAGLVLWLLALLCDSVDGMVARRQGRASAFGALWDQACDHCREILVVAALAHYRLVSPLAATLYAFAYPAHNLALLLCNRHGVPLLFSLKTYLVLYPALIAYLGWGVNRLTLALVVAVLAMSASTGLALWRLRGAMG